FHIETQTLKNKFLFIKEGPKHKLELVTTNQEPVAVLKTGKKKTDARVEEINLAEKVGVNGYKAGGNKLCEKDLLEITVEEKEEEQEATPEVQEQAGTKKDQGDDSPTLF